MRGARFAAGGLEHEIAEVERCLAAGLAREPARPARPLGRGAGAPRRGARPGPRARRMRPPRPVDEGFRTLAAGLRHRAAGYRGVTAPDPLQHLLGDGERGGEAGALDAEEVDEAGQAVRSPAPRSRSRSPAPPAGASFGRMPV